MANELVLRKDAPALSILIPAIPSRYNKAIALYEKLLSMIGDRNIEVLMLMDNKKRTIGEKRNDLKDAANGKYFMFCDDDDDILTLDALYEACCESTLYDVITFKSKCRNNSGSTFIVTFGLGNEVEHNNDGNGNYIDLKRPPFHVCAWSFAYKVYKYPSVNYAEDWGWIEQCLKTASTEKHINEVVHAYNFDPTVSEASTESNTHWTNPNHPIDLPVYKQIISLVDDKINSTYKKAIVNLISKDVARYLMGQKRLRESLVEHIYQDANGNPEISTYYFIGEEKVNSPLHKENPYAFKIYAIERMRELGYNQILWLDASVVAVKNPIEIFKRISEKGIFFEEAGHYVGSWCNDETLAYFGITREQAMKMPMYSAGFSGFDFTNPIAVEFFAEWKESMLNGMFKGSWTNHRHDMTCGSIIANKHGLTDLYARCGDFFAYVGPQYAKPNEGVPFHVCGL